MPLETLSSSTVTTLPAPVSGMTDSAFVCTQPWFNCDGVMLKFGREWTA